MPLPSLESQFLNIAIGAGSRWQPRFSYRWAVVHRTVLVMGLLTGLTGSATALPAQATSRAPQVESPDSYTARLRRARDLATSGDPVKREQALALYDTMLVASPGNADVLLGRGRTYAWSRRYAESEADFRAVVAAKPTYADAWSALGDMLMWNDRPREAVEAYGHWVEVAPDAPEPLLARGRARRDADDLIGARADFAAAGARGADPARVAALTATTQPRQAVVEGMSADGYRWSLRTGRDETQFSGNRAPAIDDAISLRRRFERGSLALEWLQADRFGRIDQAWSLDGYTRLWRRAYTNLRYQYSAAGGALPSSAWRTEVFQGVGRGWELSASVDHLRFSSNTEYYAFGLGRYTGNWYLRYRLIPGSGSQRATIRRYYRGTADDFLGLTVARGPSAELDQLGAPVRRNNAGIGVTWSRYFRPEWGFRLGAGYDDVDGIQQRQVNLSLNRRW